MRLHLAITLIASSLAAIASPSGYLEKPDTWFRSDEGRKTTACILSWQSDQGSWPKNTDTTRKEFTGDRSKLKGTFDNKATTGELRYLAQAFNATGDKQCLKAFLAGVDHILEAQYPNGGWPQYFPLSRQYHRHITFNDGSMVRIMEFLREIMTSKDYAFVDKPRRESARKAFELGIECIVKCQITVDEKPTVWCAQHDEVTLKPANARAYELATLSGAESAGILQLLMSLDKPSDDVVRSVNAGAAWFESSKIEGIRIEKINGDRTVVKDSKAPPLWARFYEIETQRPVFCDRDGVIRYELAEIGQERRNGYAWYGNWGEKVAQTHAAWRHR